MLPFYFQLYKKKNGTVREDTHKKGVFLVVGPLRSYHPYPKGLVVNTTFFMCVLPNLYHFAQRLFHTIPPLPMNFYFWVFYFRIWDFWIFPSQLCNWRCVYKVCFSALQLTVCIQGLLLSFATDGVFTRPGHSWPEIFPCGRRDHQPTSHRQSI